MRRTFVHFLWGALVAILAFVAVFFISVWNGWIGYMPDMDDLANPIDKYASQVYSSDGKLIGTWNLDKANRVAVDYNNLSPHLVHALRRMNVSMSILALTSSLSAVLSLSVDCSGRLALVVALLLPSSWLSSCIRRKRIIPLSVFCKSR